MPDQTPAPDPLATAMQTLYAAAPDEFMAVRSALLAETKAAGSGAVATEIGKLRKPSLAAWAVNLTARSAPDIVAALTDLGDQMRTAQSRLDAGALTSMRGERDAAVDAFVRAATDLVRDVGRKLSPAAQQDVRGTAIAALADERASAAVTSGQLTRALSYSGFGEVDLDEAVARTTGGAILTILPGGRGQAPRGGDSDAGSGRAARRGARSLDSDDGHDGDGDTEAPTAEELEDALDAAERALAKTQAAVDAARERAEDTRERLAVVGRQLGKAREADERALEAVTDAVRARKQAEAARHTAQTALDDASGRD